MNYMEAMKAIDQQAEALCDLSHKIWAEPELGWKEVKASKWTAEYLKSQGFDVELGAYGIPTAIRAVCGHGHPVIGFCAEYDALPGLSQELGTEKKAAVADGPGQGCGHNLLGVGCAAACVGLKAELEASGKEGTIIFYGCPAEELLTGKGFMAKAGAFFECDLTIAWHPATDNRITTGAMTGLESAIFTFHGRTSHAAANPQEGRSALDAVQLMNMGVEFLREHMTDDVRMHYAIRDGGLAPNIVPDRASVHYFVRALTREAVLDAYERVVRCAEGAAHMTETTFTIEPFGGIYPTLQNKVIGQIFAEENENVPLPEYTEEELAFADAINRNTPYYEEGKTAPIDMELHGLEDYNGFASTDYGDVMHICPGFQYNAATASTLSGGHSWMITSCSGSSIGDKGTIRAGKVMAAAAMRLIDDPALVEAAKKEFAEEMGGKSYVCPIRDDVKIPF